MKELRDFMLNGIASFKWLLVALHQTSGDLLEVFDIWRGWHATDRPSAPDPVPYYVRPDFARDFLQFVRELHHRRPDWWNTAVATLVESTAALYRAEDDESSEPVSSNGHLSCGPGSVPRLARGVHLTQLPSSYKVVVRSLKKKARLDRIGYQPIAAATRISDANRAELLELTSFSTRLLNLCDGVRTVAEIGERFSHTSSGGDLVEGVSPEAICLVGFDSLREQSLVVV